MRRLISLSGAAAVALAAACIPAQAWIPQKSGVTATSQILFMHPIAGSANTDQYSPVGYATSQSVLSTDTIAYSVFPVAGQLSGLLVNGTIAATGSQVQVVQVNKNGSSTALSCTISVSAPTSCTSGSTVSISAGDYISVLVHPTGANGSNRITAALKFTPTTPNDTIVFGQIQAASNSTASSVHPNSNFNPLAASTKLVVSPPDGGTFDRLFVVLNQAPGAAASGKKFDLYMDKAGSHTVLTAQVLETATSNNDVTHNFTIAGPSGTTAGDSIQFEQVPTSTPTANTNISFGARFRPTTSGSFWTNVQRLGESATTPLYYSFIGGTDAGGSTESSFQYVSKAMTVTKIAAKTDTAPGLAKSKTYTLRKNGADTALTCTMTNTTTTFGCTGSATVSVSEGDMLDYSITTSGSPGIGLTSISILANP